MSISHDSANQSYPTVEQCLQMPQRLSVSCVKANITVAMTSIKIVQDYEVIGIIPAFDTELSLANLRREIQEDFEISDFDYEESENGHQIDAKDEPATKVVNLVRLKQIKFL